MIYGMYCVYDVIAGAYMAPIIAVNDNVAIRSFASNFADDKGIYALNPADFRLVKVATFSPETAAIEVCASPVVVIDGVGAKSLIGK